MEKIYLVVDGSQSAPNIRHSLLSEGFPHESIVEVEQADPNLYDKIKRDADAGIAKGVIVSGSPRSVYDADATHLDKRIYDLPIKKLLICYALQDVAHQLGGAVRPADNRENGVERLKIISENPLAGFNLDNSDVVANHGDEVSAVWPGAVVTGRTDKNAVAMAYDEGRQIVAVQPHFEISGEKVRGAFFQSFRKWTDFSAREEFSPAAIEKYLSRDLAENFPLAPGKKAMVALSGGVDSTAAAAAAIKHYGRENVALVFVNTGLLRRYVPEKDGGDFGHETDKLLTLMRDQFGKVIELDASNRFIDALRSADGFDNPETNKGRRQIIGNLFADIFADWADGQGDIQYLIQGTNQADRQESGKGRGGSGRIKTHHNEVPYLRTRLLQSGIKIVEPLTWLYKNNIIALGRHLGLNMELYKQPPFPGPGLAVRIDGEVGKESLDYVGKIDAIWRNHIEAGIADGRIPPLEVGMQTRQYFAALLNTAIRRKPIEGEATPQAKALLAEAREIFFNWVAGAKDTANLTRAYVVLCNTISTTGQKGDGRVDGYQIEARLFDQGGRPADISWARRERLANDLMGLRDITRVSYALNLPHKVRAKIELNSIDTRDFTSFRSTDVPMSVLDAVVHDVKKYFGDFVALTIAYGGKPGRTTERH
ncbi:MAG: hypothetical protein LBL46_03045 [Rickettsiales bacterium]|nr:hypothetical protein [Rickettsiales bacterium]